LLAFLPSYHSEVWMPVNSGDAPVIEPDACPRLVEIALLIRELCDPEQKVSLLAGERWILLLTWITNRKESESLRLQNRLEMDSELGVALVPPCDDRKNKHGSRDYYGYPNPHYQSSQKANVCVLARGLPRR